MQEHRTINKNWYLLSTYYVPEAVCTKPLSRIHVFKIYKTLWDTSSQHPISQMKVLRLTNSKLLAEYYTAGHFRLDFSGSGSELLDSRASA